jgi:hypothetical protein
MDIHELAAAMHETLQRADIPAVDSSALKQMSKAVTQILAHSKSKATGLEVLAAFGFDPTSLTPQQFAALDSRQTILLSLLQRGVLNDYMLDEASSERVFAAAATFPCDGGDFAEAVYQLERSKSPTEVAEKMKQEMRQHGDDPDKPGVDEQVHVMAER